MANVFTSLAADIYEAAERVGRELVGGINAVKINSGAQAAAKGDIVRSSFTRPQVVSTAYNPSMTIPEGTDQTVDNKTMSLSTYASIQIPYLGEEQKSLNNGAGYRTVYGNQIQQAMRSICNKIELDLMLNIGQNAGQAYGTAGTTPFASNMNDLPNIMKLLLDRGCPDDGSIGAIYDTTAAVNIQNLSNLYKVSEAGDVNMLRRGKLGELYNVNLLRSGQVARPAVGTGTLYVLNGAHAIGATSVVLKTGSGTVLAGDVVTIGSNKYVVAVGIAAPGTITLQSGLLTAQVDGDSFAINALSRRNVVLHPDAVELAIRPLALPEGGDAAKDMMVVQDPVSGLAFTLSHYVGFKKSMIEIGCLYGSKVWLPDFAAIHLG
jgi:hypothetical protein